MRGVDAPLAGKPSVLKDGKRRKKSLKTFKKAAFEDKGGGKGKGKDTVRWESPLTYSRRRKKQWEGSSGNVLDQIPLSIH